MKSMGPIITAVFTFLLLSSYGQNPKLPPGFPDRSPNLNVLPGFQNPPKGYGDVAFFWWVGDTLTHERLSWELDQLKDKGITGLQINYCHTDSGGASYGLTYPSQPKLFSPDWWKLFQWFLKEARKRDMSVSLSDYTLGAAGQGWYVDEMLKEYPKLHGSKLESKTWDLKGASLLTKEVPDAVISAWAYKITDGNVDTSSVVNLVPYIHNQALNWQSPAGDWRIFVVYRNTVQLSWDPMNPLSGKSVNEKFYQRFADHCPGETGKGLNYFFSDELNFGIRGFLWNDAFAKEFFKRKGYDIIPELPNLFENLSPRSYKIRLDYYDVMVALTEEGFFKQVYDWHTSRGMLFGCDHGGRGKDVTEFGDYFRTQRWMSGPGCDQPGLGKDIVKAKVASSITHMYERQRTWLEGYYGSGWGTSSAEVADATFTDFAMGHNLLSFHALYYSTHGSWWEWAAPDNHFRQPYWADMGKFMTCVQRLSYVLSQGFHRCDVALLYPVTPTQANLNGKESTDAAFTMARDLYPAGIDFDFMDDQSLTRCAIKDKQLHVSGEQYKILILPDMAAIHYSTLEKAYQFYKAGGIVLAAGGLPQVSDRVGAADPDLQAMVKEMFGTTYAGQNDTAKVYSQKNKAGGQALFFHNPLDAKSIISSLIPRDFQVMKEGQTSNVMHRKLGARDLYFIYGVPKGTPCFFACSGKAELWNPWDGSTHPLNVLRADAKGTTIALPLDKTEPQLIVFSSGKPEIEQQANHQALAADTLALDNNWDFELKPTLDNRYGDYRLPAFDGKIGAEVWKMKYREDAGTETAWQQPGYDDSEWKDEEIAYGPQFWKLGALPDDLDFSALDAKLAGLKKIDSEQPVVVNGKNYYWQPYEFSWRWGLKDDVGHQGYHGMKGHVNNEIISFGIIDKSRMAMPLYPLHPEKEGTSYYLWSSVVSPENQRASILKKGLLPVKAWFNSSSLDADHSVVGLNSGANPLLLRYKGVGRGYFLLKKSGAAPKFVKPVSLATDWYLNPDVFPFNCNPDVRGTYGLYRFAAPPGTQKMMIQAAAKPEVWVSGQPVACERGTMEPAKPVDPAIPVWIVNFPDTMKAESIVALRIEQLPGQFGGAAIPEPVVFTAGKGKITLNNLKADRALATYSGGMWYRKTIQISQQQASSGKIILNLGHVVSSAEVYVNGQPAGERLTAPWTFDVSGKLKSGDNLVEALVYNTLGNHYLNTPTQYVGRTNSGLIGPVNLIFK